MTKFEIRMNVRMTNVQMTNVQMTKQIPMGRSSVSSFVRRILNIHSNLGSLKPLDVPAEAGTPLWNPLH